MSAEFIQPESNPIKVKGQDEGQGQLVAKHYNELQESGREARTESRIFYMRNFNNWIKSVAISEALDRIKREQEQRRDISVLDLCSGKGGDLLKWKKGHIKRLVCVDIAGTSVDQSESRYKDMVSRERFPDRIFSAEFITADCTKVRLRSQYKDVTARFDLCSCQFSFHYCFESLPQAELMLQNAVECLKLGGYFLGTTPNSHELVRRLRDSEDMSFGNEVYRVTYNMGDKDNIPLFGAKYNFHLEGVVDCPEFLVFFPVLEKMAEKHGMKLICKTPFADFFNEHKDNREHKNLLGRMQALERYPAEAGGKLMGLPDKDYEHVKAFVQDLTDEAETSGDNRPVSVGTLSKAEWEAVTIYCVFMFQKVKDMQTGQEWTGSQHTDDQSRDVNQSRKRRSEETSTDCPPKVPRDT